MEEDDDFGDLYSDVLRPFQSTSTPQPPLAAAQSKPQIDLNISSDDEEILCGASNSNPNCNLTCSKQPHVTAARSENPVIKPDTAGGSVIRLNLNLNTKQEDQGVKKEELSPPLGASQSVADEPAIDLVVSERDDKDDAFVGGDETVPNRTENFLKIDDAAARRDDKDGLVIEREIIKKSDDVEDRVENFSKFDIEDAEIGDMGSEPVIPGLSVSRTSAGKSMLREEDNDWDSDSEDDLQIVLDDDKNHRLLGMNTGVMGSEEDEDGDPLVILTGGEPSHQAMEEREWGEDAAQEGNGERKEGGDAAKVIGGVGMASKIGYNHHAYHPYHSQFKYVRPGAAPMPGATPVGPGGAPGQVRPPISMGLVAGHGRGEWRPLGMKGFQSGFGMGAWGNNASGRGFGVGLDFTLPSHKTIFEVDVDSFEEKPWKLAGIDVSDFFNFGLNEESWKGYCKQLEQLRLGNSMQSKIRVYESGRTEQEYDPDLPPELAAAAGMKDISSENANVGKIDAAHNDSVKEFGNVRPQLPTGRPIQVETGSGERLPSIDTRPPRIRDSDAIIEIVLQGFENDDSVPEDEAIKQSENELQREDSGSHEIEGNFIAENGDSLDKDPCPYNGRKTDDVTDGHGTKAFLPEAHNQCSPTSRGRSPDKDVDALHEERQTKPRTQDGSPDITRSGSTLDKRQRDRQKEGSVESVGGRRSPRLSSPIRDGSDEEVDVEVENVDDSHDKLALAGKERASVISPRAEACIDANSSASLKKQKVSSRAQQSSIFHINDGGKSKAEKCAENRRERSGSERDYHKSHGSVEEEVTRRAQPKIHANLKRPYDGDEHIMKTSHDARHEMGKHRLVEMRREDPYSYRDWDPHGRKERDNTRKRPVVVEEMGSGHRNKVHESDRMDKEEHFKLKKHTDNGSSRGYYDKEVVGSQHRGRDDNMKSQFDSMDDPYRKRRKEEEYMRRDVGKEEMYLGHREYTTHHRKRERDAEMDLRKREGQVRSRDEGHHSFRYKEDDWVLWERNERHRAKHLHDEDLLKWERVEGRDGVRSSRAVEDKSWVGQTRVKDKGLERDYQFKDMGRQSEQLKRRDNRVEDVSPLHHKRSEDIHVRGDHLIVHDEKRSKHERVTTRSGFENNRVHHKKNKESTRKEKDFEGGEQIYTAYTKRNQEDHSSKLKEPMMSKGTTQKGKGENEVPPNHHQSSRKDKEDLAAASSDDEQQDSRRGRSKLERWTSHKERDFTVAAKKSSSSSSLKLKEIEKYNHDVGPTLATAKLSDEIQHPSGDLKVAGDLENRNIELKLPMENNKHLDTVEKLKKRSERFKLPMPSEKEAVVTKTLENEPLPMAQEEAPPASEVKPERPARKRRWVSS